MMAVTRRGCRRTAAGGKGTKWRVEARDYEDRIDREVRKLFGAHRKTPPEKFSGGGDDDLVVAGGGRIFWGGREC
ncbi:hypothetical protein Tco_0118927 [Tanacetum coccineum]